PLSLLVMRSPPPSTVFPYTTLFRSGGALHGAVRRSDAAATRDDGSVGSSRGTLPVDGAPRRAHGLDRDERRGRGRGHCPARRGRSEEHTSELQSLTNLACRLLLAPK